MTKYWLICYQQKHYTRPDWQIANTVIKGCPGVWFHALTVRHQEEVESRFLSATPISAGAFKSLKEVL